MNRSFQFSSAALFISLFLLLHVHVVPGQTPALDSLVQKFNHYSQQAFQEKIYLHTDRSFYMTGEVMWFKLYYVDGFLHHPLTLSKVAYVEVLDSANHPVLQGKIALKEGRGNGSFYLPVSIASGNYRIRAYTNWMKNFSPDFYFEQPITLVNPFERLGLPALETMQHYDVQFFPEGGNLVEGIESKVAFKAVDQKGKGIDFRGMIVNQHQDTLLHFQPLKFGMGHFYFTPAAHHQYKAIITIGDSSFMKTLPTAYPEGYVMQVAEADNDQLSVRVHAKMRGNLPLVYLLVHTRHSLKVSALLPLKEGKATLRIDKHLLGEGISHFILFDPQRQPVCERLYFQPPSRELTIEAITDQPHYGPRENVTIDLHTQVANEAPVPANLSLSVFQIDFLALFDPTDIRTYCWLTSDLRGTIESPEYYITNNTPESREALDHLMLTQGWRKFNWETLLSGETPAFTFLPEREGPILTAKVTDKRSGEPAGRIRAYLSVPGRNFHFYTDSSNPAGEVEFVTKNIYGPTPLMVQTHTEYDSVYRFEMVSPFSEKYAASSFPGLDLSAQAEQQLQERSRSMQVQNVYWEDTIHTFSAPPADSMPFYGMPDRIFLLDDYTRFPTMEEVMREYVQGVAVRKQKGEFHYKIVNQATNIFFAEDPLILLDGIPIFDTDKAIALDPLKIKKLEVVKKKFMLGSAIFSGILSYTTYDHDLSWYQIDPLALEVDYDGMQRQRTFYAPVYETEQQVGSRMPDFRTLLYWAPDVTTDAQGNAQLSFYTADQQGTYMGVVQGMTDQGEMGSTSFTFEVKGDLTH